MLCEAFPITDLASVVLYSSQGCTTIVGDLYMLNMPASMTRSLLQTHLKTVTAIRGTLHFKDNLYLSAMTFLSNVVSLNGAVYSNNPQLIDARLFSLQQLNGNVTVEGCNRLCPARYTSLRTAVDERGCANPELRYFLHIEGSATKNNVDVVGSIMRSALQNVTGGAVRVWVFLRLIWLDTEMCCCLVERHIDGEGDRGRSGMAERAGDHYGL